MRVKVRLSDARVRATVEASTSAASQRGANAAVRRARNNLAAADRHRTGTLSRSIRAQKVRSGVVSTWAVGSPLPYAIYQETGFGPVYPVKAKALRFIPKGGGAFVFAQKTKGLTGAHYLKNAVNSLVLRDFLP